MPVRAKLLSSSSLVLAVAVPYSVIAADPVIPAGPLVAGTGQAEERYSWNGFHVAAGGVAAHQVVTEFPELSPPIMGRGTGLDANKACR